jgi:cation transport protein ChaC
VTLDDGSEATALVFVAEPRHPLYERDASVPSIASFVAAASGPLGSNADYVLKLQAALTEWGVIDEYVEALVDALRRGAFAQPKSETTDE